MTDRALVAEFVASFEKLDELAAFQETDPAAWSLRLGGPGKYGATYWRPRSVKTGRRSLDALYRRLPHRLPTLYEELVLSYRWAEVDLGELRLLANPPSPGLAGLEAEIFRDVNMTEQLLRDGFLQFGKGPDVNYDPVCFKMAGTTPDQAAVVQIDHEYLLCDSKIVVTAQLAVNLRALMEDVVEKARAA